MTINARFEPVDHNKVFEHANPALISDKKVPPQNPQQLTKPAEDKGGLEPSHAEADVTVTGWLFQGAGKVEKFPSSSYST